MISAPNAIKPALHLHSAPKPYTHGEAFRNHATCYLRSLSDDQPAARRVADPWECPLLG